MQVIFIRAYFKLYPLSFMLISYLIFSPLNSYSPQTDLSSNSPDSTVMQQQAPDDDWGGISSVDNISPRSTVRGLAFHTAVQATAVLRNLAVVSCHLSSFLSANTLAILRHIMQSMSQCHEVVLNVGRILSKLSLHEECQVSFMCRSRMR